MKHVYSLLFLLITSYCAHAQQEPLQEGVHNFTLQWIGWNSPGKVQIDKKENSIYTIKGEQRSADKTEFATITGTLQVLSARELLFEGKIQTRTNDNNNGEVCDKTGTYHFLATGDRKYWRLQEMDNCEGNNVVDYVDIYF